MNLSDFDIYAFFCANGIGNRKINRLLKSDKRHFEGVEKILEMTPDEIAGFLGNLGDKDIESLKSLDIDAIKAEYELMLNSGIEMITAGSVNYPCTLKKRLGPDAPAILFCFGKLDIINIPAISVVGSRDISDRGEEITGRLIDAIADDHVSIISGGAKGIDAAAHNSAIERGLNTIVVTAYGINEVLKRQVDETILRIVLFLSQFHPNSRWRPAFAMMRNKTVCALSKAIFVVEAGETGGTVNTGETALQIGIPLYVISPDEFKIPPPGNRYLISKGGRELFLDSISESFDAVGD
jgi:DNA processing protein